MGESCTLNNNCRYPDCQDNKTENNSFKDKAKELLDKFRNITGVEGKECALICVDEIQKVTNYEINYWEEVKQEIKQAK